MSLRTTPRDGDTDPVHLLVTSGTRWSMCGKKDPLPRVWVAYAQAHADGHDPLFCDRCVAAMPVDELATKRAP